MLSAARLPQVRAEACILLQASWERSKVRRTKSSVRKRIIVRRTVRSMFGEQTVAQLRTGFTQASAFVFRRQRYWKLENFWIRIWHFCRGCLQWQEWPYKSVYFAELAGKDATEKAKTFTYAAEVRNEDGDIVWAAESRESVSVLKAKFRELCNPLTNVIIEPHKFNTRFQEVSEPVQNFINMGLVNMGLWKTLSFVTE